MLDFGPCRKQYRDVCPGHSGHKVTFALRQPAANGLPGELDNFGLLRVALADEVGNVGVLVGHHGMVFG